MRKLTAVALALAFAGITFAQPEPPAPPPPPPAPPPPPYAQPAPPPPPPPGSYQGQYPIGGPKHYREWWCSQNWEQCKQMKLADLSGRKECLEKSQSYEAYRECEFLRKHGYRLR